MPNPEYRIGVIRPVDIYKEAFAIMKDEFWLLFAVTLVGFLIAGIVPLILLGPMFCGIYMCMLDKADGRRVAFDRLFKGFGFFLPGLIVSLLIVVPIIALFLTVYIPLIAMAFAGPRMSEAEVWSFVVGTLALEIVLGVVMTVLHSFLIFAFPLIVDRGLNGFEAVRLSARAAWANRGGVAALYGVTFLVTIAGYLAFCVGVYLAMPIIMMAMAVAYRKVFPSLETARFEPPPPGAYQGLK